MRLAFFATRDSSQLTLTRGADAALLRPGRIDRRVYVPPPDCDARLQILRIALRRTPHAIDDETLQRAAAACQGFSGAEVASVVRDACLAALRADMQARELHATQLFEAIARVEPQITPAMTKFYEEYALNA